MSRFLYWIVELIAKVHNYLISLNDNFEYTFTDKELHFFIIGFLGMGMLFIIYPIFKALSKNHVMVIAWIYVMTVIVGLTFAIEIGQKITNTGSMEFADIVFGIFGFLIMFIIFSVFRFIFNCFKKLFNNNISEIKEEENLWKENK